MVHISVLNVSSSRNVPDSGGNPPGYIPDYTLYIQVTQQPAYPQQRPPPPPSQFPVPLTYPIGGYASAIPRLEPDAPPLEIEHVNHHTRARPSAALPQVQARAPEHSAHPPPYFSGGFATLGRSDIPGSPYPASPSHPSESPSPRPQVRNTSWPSPRTQPPPPPPPPRYDVNRHSGHQSHRPRPLAVQPYCSRIRQKKALLVC
ncbi:hypothetical protein BJY52DRAFT_203585 [Lactarius psammicola]|nr:hypothetical protein BJY52DRAFT_203585 [Lactarius psammicola]